MNEFEQRLNAVLNDPAEMEKLSRLAAQLMGGEAPAADAASGTDGELLHRLTKLLGSGGSDKTALAEALAPYLKPERREKLQKALRMAHLARLARAALEESGG